MTEIKHVVMKRHPWKFSDLGYYIVELQDSMVLTLDEARGLARFLAEMDADDLAGELMELVEGEEERRRAEEGGGL